jgi:hypothetical protein
MCPKVKKANINTICRNFSFLTVAVSAVTGKGVVWRGLEYNMEEL